LAGRLSPERRTENMRRIRGKNSTLKWPFADCSIGSDNYAGFRQKTFPGSRIASFHALVAQSWSTAVSGTATREAASRACF
jgi:hypothetical protein